MSSVFRHLDVTLLAMACPAELVSDKTTIPGLFTPGNKDPKGTSTLKQVFVRIDGTLPWSP